MMREYLVVKQYDKGDRHLPPGTKFIRIRDMLTYEGVFMCKVHSQRAVEHTVGNDDKRGIERGELIRAINVCLRLANGKYDRLMKLWNDSIALSYSNGGDPNEDSWIWNDEFYCADIDTLNYIFKLIKEV